MQSTASSSALPGSLSTITNVPTGTIDPIEKFKQDVEALRVSGSGVWTIIGWTLYLLVAIDALLNARGTGSLSMWIAGTVMAGKSALEPRGTGFALLVSSLQILLLGIGGVSLRSSPWRRWLPRRLRETWPGNWIVDVWRRSLQSNSEAATINIDVWRIALELLVFILALVILAPCITLLSGGPFWAPFFGGALVLLLGYGMTQLILAVVPAVHRDVASAAGLLIGYFIPLAFVAYADPPSVVLHALPNGLAEFTAFQLVVLTFAVGGIWLTQLGSVSETERITLDLDLGLPTGVLRELPDAVNGEYKPFQFRVIAHNKKVILLSRPDSDARHFRVHSTLDWHDLTSARWLLLNLDELEQSVGTGGKISLVRHGHTGYFECPIDLYLHTVSPEVYLGHLRGRDVTIAIDELYGLQHRLLHGSDVASKLRQDLDLAIGNELDNAIDSASGSGTYSITSLQSLHGSMRMQVSQLKQVLDMQVAACRTIALTGLRVDREEEIRAYVFDALKNVTPLIEQVRQEYGKMIRLDQGMSGISAKLQNKLRVAVEQALRRFTNVSVQTDASDTVNIRLLDLITLSVQPVTVHLTPDAQKFHQEIDALYKEFDTHVNQATQELGAIAREYGDIGRTTSDKILAQPTTPPKVRIEVFNRILGPSPPAPAGPFIPQSGPPRRIERPRPGGGTESSGPPPATDSLPLQSGPLHILQRSRSTEDLEGSGPRPATDSPFPD